MFYSLLVVGSMPIEAVCVVVAARRLLDQQFVGHLVAVAVEVEAGIWVHRDDVGHIVHIRVLALRREIVTVAAPADDSCLNLDPRVQWEVVKVALY